MESRLEFPPAQPPQTENELDCFFANTLGMLCVAGFDGYFKRLNPAWTATLGWSLEELQSRPFMEFVHPHDRPATRAEMEKLTGGGHTIRFQNRYRCRDDSYKWLQWNANSQSNRGQVYAMACDITSSKALKREIIETTDREKERLGRELHDGLCQNLAGIAALFQVSCSFRCRCPDLKLGSEVDAHLYRIAQEAVNNAITHGRARSIQISLAGRDGNGRLSVRDNGVGIPRKATVPRGVGIHTMEYRSRWIGGSLEVRPRSRRGTAVTCVFPFPKDESHDAA